MTAGHSNMTGANGFRFLTPDEESKWKAPRCDARRRYTSATCEHPAHWCMFEVRHVGRDRAGRWHVWPRRMATGKDSGDE